jgi:SAM-dependent methyltransferase
MDAALREMYRVCKPGGYIAMANFNRTPPPFDPGWSVLLEQFMTYQVGVRMPQQVTYTPQEVEALLGRFGLRSIETNSETYDIIYASEDDWWAFQLNLGPRATIMGMDEEMRARFKDEHLARLRPMFRRDGLHMSVSVVYSLAQR